MKSKYLVLGVALSILVIAAMCAYGQPANALGVETEIVATNSISLPPGVEQLAGLLGEKAKAFILQVAVWLGSISLMLSPFAVWIRHKLFDIMNAAAESEDEDDDAWLGRVFANPIYRFVAMLLRFVRFDLPTSKDLERAIALQKDTPKTTGG